MTVKVQGVEKGGECEMVPPTPVFLNAWYRTDCILLQRPTERESKSHSSGARRVLYRPELPVAARLATVMELVNPVR